MSFLTKHILKSYQFYLVNSNNHIKKFSTTYKKLLVKRPFLMQAIQAGILMTTGDLIAQTIIEETPIKNIDYIRTGNFFTIGFCVAGPGLRIWYGVLDKLIKGKTPFQLSLKKVAFDQLCFAPVFLGLFLTIIGFLQRPELSLVHIKKKLNNEYFDILMTNYMIWPWTQLINFRFVPLNYQVLLAQFVAVLWNVYISWKTNVNERNKSKIVMIDIKDV